MGTADFFVNMITIIYAAPPASIWPLKAFTSQVDICWAKLLVVIFQHPFSWYFAC